MYTDSFWKVLWICCLLMAACGGKNKKLIDNAPLISKSFTDDTGHTIKLAKTPERIVSIAPNITEMVYAIGAEDMLVARSQVCDYPLSVKDKPIVSTYPKIDYEGLAALKPDLVLATDELFSADVIAAIERLGIPVYLQKYRKTEDIAKGIRTLGTLLEKEKAANQLADSLTRIEKRIMDSTKNEIKYRTLILVSNDPLIVAGGIGFLNEYILKAGGMNVYEKSKDAYTNTTIEDILYSEPEYLIIPSDNDQIYGDLATQFPDLHDLPAAIYKHIFIVDPDLFYRPGPRYIEGLARLTRTLHSHINTPDFFYAQ